MTNHQSEEYRKAVRDGMLHCAVARKAREDVGRIIAALVDAGHADLVAGPMIRDAAIVRELEAMRASSPSDPALRRALMRKPRSVLAYLRRRPDVLADVLAEQGDTP